MNIRSDSPTAADQDSAHEILDTVLHILEQNSGRLDLWMMRFEITRSLGLKTDFISAMKEASANPILRRDLDWKVISRMWSELAPGETPPEGIVLPKIASSPPVAKDETVSARRFSDIALQVAGGELEKLAQDYQTLRARPDFFMEFARRMHQTLQRPTPLHHAQTLERELSVNNRIFLKREDLHHDTPEMEIAAAQAYFAMVLGRKFVITGNDVDEFSLALAKVGKHYGLNVCVVVRPDDFTQKAELVAQLQELGATVDAMDDNGLKSQDPREGALLRWKSMTDRCYLALSFGTGPHPYPRMVGDFQMLLGYESELQLRAKAGPGRPRTLVAAVHGESDSIGFMLPYLKRSDIDLFYAEPEHGGRDAWKSSVRLRAYNGARREHAWLRATGRITHIPITDVQARAAQQQLKQLEDISVSLEDARAVVLATGLAHGDTSERDIVVLLG
jgi:tryptophan synthase beta chain